MGKELKEKSVAKTILMPSFFNTVIFCLKVSSLLVCMLCLVDGEKKLLWDTYMKP